VTRRALPTAAAAPPTWEQLATRVAPDSRPEPLLTLFRDTNGWCPFCERVWIALREKGIPYDEVLINLYDKPQWYKDMVPTSLVPAVKFASSGEVVWESEAILRRLDSEFPESRPLFAEPARVEAAAELPAKVMNASMGLAYRTGDLQEESLEDRRAKLASAIDSLEEHLAGGGPFLLGKELSAADLMAVPMLERYGFQLPYFAAELQIRDPARWPAIAGWFDAMEARPAYSERVVGDEYSWTAVAPVLMRIFSGQNGTLEGPAAARAQVADAAAANILESLEENAEVLLSGAPKSARLEAAEKLLANHEAVVDDATALEPKSQKELLRLDPSKRLTVDAVLRAAAGVLLSGEKPGDAAPREDSEGAGLQPADVSAACRYIAARLCAPRDMSAPAATALRAALLGMARAVVLH